MPVLRAPLMPTRIESPTSSQLLIDARCIERELREG
jgi:hypothetical protein